MNLLVNLPADLEKTLQKRASEAGVDLSTYVVQMLRADELPQVPEVTDEQFTSGLAKLKAIHQNANPNFDDSRESIYGDRDE